MTVPIKLVFSYIGLFTNRYEDHKESKELDYDEDHLEEKQEEKAGEINQTRNQVF